MKGRWRRGKNGGGVSTLKDATSRSQLWGDLWLLTSVQGLPLLIVLSFLLISPALAHFTTPLLALLGLNLFLVVIRFAMLFAIAPSYDRKSAKGGWLFWLSPLADPLAVLRIFLSAFHKPREWRGRKYI